MRYPGLRPEKPRKYFYLVLKAHRCMMYWFFLRKGNLHPKRFRCFRNLPHLSGTIGDDANSIRRDPTFYQGSVRVPSVAKRNEIQPQDEHDHIDHLHRAHLRGFQPVVNIDHDEWEVTADQW